MVDWLPLITLFLGILGGIAAAFYGPLISDYISKRRLRQNLYRELINFYERAKWCIKTLDHIDKEHYIALPVFDKKERLYIRDTIIEQSLANPQIWRDDLLYELSYMDFLATELRRALIDNNLFYAVQKDPKELRIFYQLDESAALYDTFQDFFLMESDKLDPHYNVSTCTFLTQDDAKRLNDLDYLFNNVRKACHTFEEKEDTKELDPVLSSKMRGWKPRETIFIEPGIACEGYRWCKRCRKVVLPKWPSTLDSFARYYATKFFCYYAQLLRFEGLHKVARRYSSLLRIKECIAYLTKERCVECGAKVAANEQALKLVCMEVTDAMTRSKPTITKDQVETIDNLCQLQHSADPTKAAMEVVSQALKTDDCEVKIKALECIGNNVGRLDIAKEGKASECIERKEENGKILEAVAKDVDRILKDPRKSTNLRQRAALRKKAAWAYGEIHKGDKTQNIDTLLSVLRNSCFNSEIRSAAAAALGKIGNDKAVDSLKAVVTNNHENTLFRKEAIYALGNMGSPAISLSIQILNNEQESSDVRYAAAYLLGQIGDDQTAVSCLSRAARDQNAIVRYWAQKALALINPHWHGPVRAYYRAKQKIRSHDNDLRTC